MLFKPTLPLLLATALGFFATCLTASTEQLGDWSRFSQYVPVRDGTKLALDCYIPIPDRSASGAELEGRHPVVLRFTPYGRRFAATKPYQLPQVGVGLNGSKPLRRLTQRGYAVCIADARGYGASFGSRSTWLGFQDALDVRDIVDWLGVQSWSNGQIGMIGSSWLGSVQYWALVEASPYLKALFVGNAQYDHYATFFDNGIYRPDLELAWQTIRERVDFGADGAGVAAVDGETGVVQLRAARAGHRANTPLGAQIRPLLFRDTLDKETGRSWHLENSVWFHRLVLEDQSVAVYHIAGWWDAYAKDQLLAYTNFGGPKKLHVGPYFHGETFGVDLIGEALRWFDYWLVGIDNGIMNEPPIRYYRVGAGWEQDETWTALGGEPVELYLGAEMLPTGSSVEIKHGSVSSSMSLNHHFLQRNNGTFRQGLCGDSVAAPAECYASPYLTDMGLPINGATQRFSLPLSQDLEVTGHPLASLWLSPLSSDVEISIVLAVDLNDGQQRYVSGAMLKVSHRWQSKPPVNHLGLPWLNQSNFASSQEASDPILVEVDLQPVAVRLSAGSTLTLMVTAIKPSNKGGGNPIPLEIYQREGFRSSLQLPVKNEGML